MHHEKSHLTPERTEQLIQQSRLGDRNALGELLDANTGRLESYCRHHHAKNLQARFDDDDAIQDTFALAIERFPQFHGNTQEGFSAWLKAILRHVLDNLRRRNYCPERDVRHERSCEVGRNEPGQPSWIDVLPGLWRIHVGKSSLLIPSSVRPNMRGSLSKWFKAWHRLPDRDQCLLFWRRCDHIPYKELTRWMDGDPRQLEKEYARACRRMLKELRTEGLMN